MAATIQEAGQAWPFSSGKSRAPTRSSALRFSIVHRLPAQSQSRSSPQRAFESDRRPDVGREIEGDRHLAGEADEVGEQRAGLIGVPRPGQGGQYGAEVVRANGAQVHPNRSAAAQHEADIADRQRVRDCRQQRGGLTSGQAKPVDVARNPAAPGGSGGPMVAAALHRQEDPGRCPGAGAGVVPFQEEAVEVAAHPAGIGCPGGKDMLDISIRRGFAPFGKVAGQRRGVRRGPADELMKVHRVAALAQPHFQSDPRDGGEPGGGRHDPGARRGAYQAVGNGGPEQGERAHRRQVGVGLPHRVQATPTGSTRDSSAVAAAANGPKSSGSVRATAPT
jgi:hypothetical protein